MCRLVLNSKKNNNVFSSFLVEAMYGYFCWSMVSASPYADNYE